MFNLETVCCLQSGFHHLHLPFPGFPPPRALPTVHLNAAVRSSGHRTLRDQGVLVPMDICQCSARSVLERSQCRQQREILRAIPKRRASCRPGDTSVRGTCNSSTCNYSLEAIDMRTRVIGIHVSRSVHALVLYIPLHMLLWR